jgi:hypothetical protein
MEDVTMTTTTASNNITTEPTTGSSSSSSTTENEKENDNNTETQRPPIWLQRLVENDCPGGRRSKWSADNNRKYEHYLDTTDKPRPRRKSQPPQKFVPPTTTTGGKKKKDTKKKDEKKKSSANKGKHQDSKPTTRWSFMSPSSNRTFVAMEEEDHHFESFFDFCEHEAFSAAPALRELYRRFRASQQPEEKSVVI